MAYADDTGAIVRQHYSNRLTASMAQKSLRVYEKFDDIVGGPSVFTRSGMVLIVNEKDRAGLDANVKMQQDLGIDVRPVAAQVLAEIDPNARLNEDEVAIYEAEAGYVESVQVVASSRARRSLPISSRFSGVKSAAALFPPRPAAPSPPSSALTRAKGELGLWNSCCRVSASISAGALIAGFRLLAGLS